VAYLGEIRPFAGPLPRGWLPCDGRLLDVRNHVALFAVIDYAYGGDGKLMFALPDLRGRVTAGADESKGQPVGHADGQEGESLIPFAVINWGIAVGGTFPVPPQ
jgi:microcystin-dependent protein